MAAEDTPKGHGTVKFDTDSIPVGADVCASATLSGHKELFTNLETVDNVFLKGVSGKLPVVAKGTLTLPLKIMREISTGSKSS